MDLEKIEISKKILKAPDFATLKQLSLIILRYQSSPSRSQAELLTILWMRSCFEKNRAVKHFDIMQKNQFEKKNRGSSRVEGSGLQLGVIPYFLTPREILF